ncbi:MAG: hypothetical protein BroJett005_21970 [Ignavibacteriota bacterium]|nr:MAG: hypothetical protein BroJett005_21970 [Ignavibacteriota bacterium]
MEVNFKHITHLRGEEITKFIKNNIRIEDVVNKLGGLDLTRTGNSLQGNCPTGHSSQGEKCFSINTDKNFYHCFNCGAAGDNISLVELVNNLGFSESLNWFKENFELDLDVTEEIRQENKTEQSSYYINQFLLEEIVKLGHNSLFENSGKEALAYLTEQRGYSLENLKNTEWFYLPQVNRVKEILNTKYPSYSKQIDELQLNGYYGDNFRLAFPYRDRYGKITGFLKRALNPKGADIKTFDNKEHRNVRWDSSRGTVKKDLFGISNCKKADTLLILEGYPDAIYLPTLGLKNVVAVGQGLLSESHLEALKEFKIKNVIISFDNDPPKADGELTGVENTIKAVDLLTQKSDINVFVLDPRKLGVHKDPDEFVKANGIETFQELIDNAEFGLVWRAEGIISKYDLSVPQQWQDALEEILKYDLAVKDQLKSHQLLSTAANKLKVNVTIIEEQALSYQKKVEREQVSSECNNLIDKTKNLLNSGKLEESVSLMEKELQSIRVKVFKNSMNDDSDLAAHLTEKFEREKERTADLLGYRLNKFSEICKNVDGLQPGFYFIGAETNVGKTAFTTNLLLDVIKSNPKVKGLYLSLDDNKDVIINRLVGIESGISLNKLQKKRDDDVEEIAVHKAYDELIKLSKEERLHIYDISQVNKIEDVEALIAKIGNENLVVIIDGLYNLGVAAEGGIRIENIKRANTIKTLVDVYRIPLICTGELRKKTSEDSAKKKRTNDDIMESGKFGYNANVVWILSASNKQDGMIPGEELKLNIEFTKNKLSHFKGFQELKFKKFTGTVEEIKQVGTPW